MEAGRVEDLRRALLGRVADDPLTVETRAVLARPSAEIFGDPAAPERAVVRDEPVRLLAAVGRAGREELAAATTGLDGLWEIIAPIEEQDRLARLLPEWIPEPALVYEWALGEPEPVAEVEAEVEVVLEARPGLIDHLEGRAAREIGRALGSVPLAAAIVDGAAVSFCYAYLETETLWAVAIETLEGFRRRGFARACAQSLIAYQASRDKLPVWGAHEGNAASQGLAKRLGFHRCGRIAALQNRAEE